MTGSLIRLEVRRSRVLVGWLAFICAAYAGVVAAMYPTLLANSAAFDEYMKVWPKEMLAVFGMEGGLADPGTFFNTYIAGMLWPIAAAIGGIILAARSTAADVDRGWTELTLAAPVSRSRYLVVAIANQVLAMALLAASTVAALVLVGAVVGAGFDVPRFAVAGVGAFAFGCAIAAVTTLIGAVTLSRGVAGGVVAGLLLAMYLLHAVAKIQPDLDWVAYLSAFNYYDTTAIIDEGVIPSADLGVFAAVAIAAWGLAVLVFRRRDILA